MYVVGRMWPDIAYVMSYPARFMANPGWAHWEAIKQIKLILKRDQEYKASPGEGGTLTWEEGGRQSHIGVKGYSKANGNSQEHCHTISGYVCLLHWWGSCLRKTDKAGDYTPIYNGFGVYGNDTCSQGGHLDAHVSGRNTVPSIPFNAPIPWQPVCHHCS